MDETGRMRGNARSCMTTAISTHVEFVPMQPATGSTRLRAQLMAARKDAARRGARPY
ncbi:hypothetical protein [Neoroseomonas soli]|uniref:Uncharacterized protein n=1 Tax=Neoroseomonas soli TaxID=1081025 RepID=A0A9X9X329_9PROT|nr:hypothetical protein [Neoroseomonas soli]MBR0673808.1 hypothetical protein [Neoroseomonas soli]